MTAEKFYDKSEIFPSDSSVHLYKKEIIKLMENYAEQKLMEERDQLENTYEK